MDFIGRLKSVIISGNRAEKEAAIFELRNQGSMATDQVPFLLRLVKDPDYDDLLGTIGYAIDEIGLGLHIASPEFLELLTDAHARVPAWAIGYLFFNFYTDYIPSINQEVLLRIVRLLEDHEPLSPGEGQSHLTDNGWWAFCLLDKWRSIVDVQLRVTENGCDFWRAAACGGGDLTTVLLGIVALSFFPEPARDTYTRLFAQPTFAARETVVKSCFWLGQLGIPLLEQAVADADRRLGEVAKYILGRVEGGYELF